jgi:UDP-N-acetylglucosamine--N-acetylmuramyl-(pentapeptide) pyrophosphoryl-undecaprenol N-acetylglucosamine transferase
LKIIIAGGGTGGHLFPGIAVAEEFLKRSHENDVRFIGTEKGLEKKVLKGLGFQLYILPVEGIKGRGFLKTLTALMKIPRSFLQSYRIIHDFKPDIVIGVGGYASGPAVMMARFMGIRTVIMEQNALPGITNRILGKCVDRIFLTFPDTAHWFPEKKTIVCGNPVRSAFLSECGTSVVRDRKFTILIFGGSQGAHAINTAVIDAFPYLDKIGRKLKLIHQTGEKDLESVLRSYEAHGIDAEVLPFITDMAGAYRSSDLIICRAGATSIAEITACGKAAILIPFPFAVNDHQTKNAEILVRSNAAIMIHEKDLTGKRLAETLDGLYRNPQAIREMEEQSGCLGNTKAASDIADACQKITA